MMTLISEKKIHPVVKLKYIRYLTSYDAEYPYRELHSFSISTDKKWTNVEKYRWISITLSSDDFD